MGRGQSDALRVVQETAAEVSAHPRAGSLDSLYRAEVLLEEAIHAAADAGHRPDEIVRAGASAPLGEDEVRRAILARSSRERAGGDG